MKHLLERFREGRSRLLILTLCRIG